MPSSLTLDDQLVETPLTLPDDYLEWFVDASISKLINNLDSPPIEVELVTPEYEQEGYCTYEEMRQNKQGKVAVLLAITALVVILGVFSIGVVMVVPMYNDLRV
jgi:hypothetical protein